MLLRQKEKWTMPLILLCAAGVLEFLFLISESLFYYIGYYLAEDLVIIPTLLFVGLLPAGKVTPFARKRLLLAGAAVVWFLFAQIVHKLSGTGSHPIGTVLFVYLMAFPFAAATEDRDSRGLRVMGILFTAATLVQVGYSVMLTFGQVPEFMQDVLYWDGKRLHVLWHPNISACFFMIGIGLSVGAAVATSKVWKKLVLSVPAVMLFLAMALTNCRTTLLLTSAFFGGTAFFLIIRKGGWKRVLVGLTAALVIAGCSFWFSGVVYEKNGEHIEKIAAEQKLTGEKKVTIRGNVKVNKETGEVTIRSKNPQDTLSKDMRTLNGRTAIWKAVLQAVRGNKRLALVGTEDAGPAISWYSPYEVVHAHNSWMETLVRLGIPGLLLALVFTGLAIRSAWVLVWSRYTELWKKMIAMLTMCVMVAGILEPYLFITNVYYHITDYMFFFLVGYLDYWCAELPSGKETAM